MIISYSIIYDVLNQNQCIISTGHQTENKLQIGRFACIRRDGDFGQISKYGRLLLGSIGKKKEEEILTPQ